MSALSLRHNKQVIASLAIIGMVFGSVLPSPVLAQTAPAPATQTEPDAATTALRKQSQELQEELIRENEKLEALKHEFIKLQRQIQLMHPSNTATLQAGARKPAQPAAHPAETAEGKKPGTSMTQMVQASKTSLKKPAESAALKTAYQQENALFRPGFTFYPQFQYSYSNSQNLVLNGFLAFNAILLGNINVSRSELNLFTWNPQIYYAFNRHFELTFDVPYIYELATYQSVGASTSTGKTSSVREQKWGIGDINGGFNWQVMDQHGWWPNLIWNTQVSAPTGTSPYGIKLVTDVANNNLKYPNDLPTGKGVWGISSGFTFIREFDPAVLFGSGSYTYEFTQHVGDVSPILGQTKPGEVAPGNSLTYSLGVTTLLNERLTTLLEIQDIITNSTAIKPDGGTWSTVLNSDTNAAQFILGASYAANENFFPFIQAGIGATSAAPNFQISLWLPYYFGGAPKSWDPASWFRW